eukprot:SAG31_NODE_1695_length_7508_cov_2.975030_12_plen_212_part_00
MAARAVGLCAGGQGKGRAWWPAVCAHTGQREQEDGRRNVDHCEQVVVLEQAVPLRVVRPVDGPEIPRVVPNVPVCDPGVVLHAAREDGREERLDAQVSYARGAAGDRVVDARPQEAWQRAEEQRRHHDVHHLALRPQLLERLHPGAQLVAGGHAVAAADRAALRPPQAGPGPASAVELAALPSLSRHGAMPTRRACARAGARAFIPLRRSS